MKKIYINTIPIPKNLIYRKNMVYRKNTGTIFQFFDILDIFFDPNQDRGK